VGFLIAALMAAIIKRKAPEGVAINTQ
jgi:hypothetical protein